MVTLIPVESVLEVRRIGGAAGIGKSRHATLVGFYAHAVIKVVLMLLVNF